MNKLLYIFLGPLIVFTFSGCSSQITPRVVPTKQVLPEVIEGKEFTPNQYTVSNVGDVMFTAYEYAKDSTKYKYNTFVVKQRTNVWVKHKLKNLLFVVQTGEYKLTYADEKGAYYEKNGRTFTGTKIGYGGLFIPKDSSNATEIYWSWSPRLPSNRFYAVQLTPPIEGSFSTTFESKGDAIGTKKPKATITYAGVANGQVKFVYNQFTDDGYIKPAFTQEVGFDYKPNGIYGYKSARFKVYKADSTQINYEVIKPLED